jgi:hypothetical protein
MHISLTQASTILDKTDDEVMFLVQTKKLQADVVKEPKLAWAFQLQEVLELKRQLDDDEDLSETDSDDS